MPEQVTLSLVAGFTFGAPVYATLIGLAVERDQSDDELEARLRSRDKVIE